MAGEGLDGAKVQARPEEGSPIRRAKLVKEPLSHSFRLPQVLHRPQLKPALRARGLAAPEQVPVQSIHLADLLDEEETVLVCGAVGFEAR